MAYIRGGNLDEKEYSPFQDIRQTFGFVPNFYRAQTLRPDLIESQIPWVGTLLVKEGALERRQKEYIFLVCSAANMSTYCVTAHCEIVRMLGIHGPEPEKIAIDPMHADIPMADKALLAFALKLNKEPRKVDEEDIEELRTYGFDDAHILETILIVGFAHYANVVSFGLGTVPDFDASRIEPLLAGR
jgi:uncharacterized peroxidase-related enzyme